MATFYTVSEAAQFISRSSSAVRRILRPIVKDDKHPDRGHVQPGVTEVRELRMRGETFGWRVSEELLQQELAARSATTSSHPPSSQSLDSSSRELVVLLRDELQKTHEQLKVKDQQIATFSEITQSLNERIREGNILIGSLQRQLSLPSGEQRSAAVAVPTDVSPTSAAPAVSKAAATRPAKSGGKKPPRKGFFARLFA